MTSNTLAELTAGVPLQHWLVLGPFVVRTGAQFEREYLYERERILDVDYLAADGGEAHVRPAAGLRHENIGVGPKHLAWREYSGSRLDGNRIAGDAIYETVQRNCAIYAAAVIESDRDTAALLDAYHSGMKAWVNGELVCDEPYGIPKGVRLTMPSKAISLRKGENVLLIKFRPGYIADGIDFRVYDVFVSPLAGERGLPIALGRVRARPWFRGTPARPAQVIEAAVVNTSGSDARVLAQVVSDTLGAEDRAETLCPAHAIATVRLALPTPPEAAGKPVLARFSARLFGREVTVPFEYCAAQPPRHDGEELVLTAFHFDTTYHEEQRIYAMGAFDIVRQYCRLHREDPGFRSTLSEVDYLKPYFDVFPEDRETLMRVFRENRSNSDVMYNQPNEQNCGGEALVRNFLYGQLFHGRVLGRICHVYSPGDVFGHPNQLSQIARKSGCIGVSWDKHIYNFPPLFMHLALDGSTIPHKRGDWTRDQAHAMGLSVTVGSIDQTPPTDWHDTLMPKVRQATYHDLMDTVTRQCRESGARLPVTSRDMSLYHAATAMSRINLKIGNRLGENTLLTAEKYATLAALLGAVYPDRALDKAWRQLLCGQHHDSITGTHNEISYVDLMNGYRETLELATEVLDRSLDYLGRAIDCAGLERPLAVFNPLAWARTDVVRARLDLKGVEGFEIRDPSGRAMPFEVCNLERNRKGAPVSAEVLFVAKQIPSLGYRVYQTAARDAPLPVRKIVPGQTVIENKYYRVEVDPERGGGIVSLYDKKAKREVVNAKAGHPGNELAALHEVRDREETQHEFYTTGLKLFSGERPARVEAECGPVSQTLRVRYRLGELCAVVQEITLYKGVARVEFRTMLLDYQGEDHLFCVTFPVKVRGAVPVFDERFGVVTRNDSRHYLDFRTHQMAMFSECGVYAANKWMEYGSSAALKAGRNKYALGMVGLITPNIAADIAVAEDLQRALIKKGVTCTPWFDKDGPQWGSYQDHMDEDRLYTRFRIAMGSRGRNAYTKALLEAQPAATRKAFEERLERDGFATLLVLDASLEHMTRLPDLADTPWPPLPVLLIEGKTAKSLSEGVGRLLADFAATAEIRLPAEADATGERRSLDDYGVALLNEGTYANSVEKGGVLCMMLAHTCLWYGGTNSFPEGYLVPENKNHVFRYALYPHAGDWRRAGAQRAGYEFNHPLLARPVAPGGRASLPAELALLTVSPDNLIVDAMKPFGNPVAGFERGGESDPSRGITVRLYDTEGVDTEARVEFAAGMKSAWLANLLEQEERKLAAPDGAATFNVPAFSIETLGFVPGRLGRKLGRKPLGPSAEPVQPVWVRSWEHDAESLPMGYGSVVCSIGREVVEEDGGRVLRLKLNAVNDYTDAPVEGVADLLLPDGWTADVDALTFRLPPLGGVVEEVRVTRPDAQAAGQIKLRHAFDGQVFQDVLEIGRAFEPEMTVENRGDAIVVTLENATPETVEAEVALVSPIETWPRAAVGAYALLEIAPRTQGVSLAPGERVELPFKISRVSGHDLVPDDSYWAVAKLMCNGRLVLKRCDRRPERRLMYARRWNALLEEAARQRRLRRRG